MKTINKLLLFFVLTGFLVAPSKGIAQLEYYFGENQTFNPEIPTPEDFFGFPIGSTLVRYDKVVEYFRKLNELSGRVSFEVIGNTYENREHVILIITSPENNKNLENIRLSHLRLTDPKEKIISLDDQKVIVHLGYNVHGGELAGTDASVLAAYYFVASENPETVKQLNNVVVLIEPSLNPDGRDRATSYYNSFKSFPPVADPLDIEHTGSFIPHRGNHFWTDLNRDWFPAVHVESKARVDFYHKWYPNVYADFHEMGSSSSYYFEPSPPHSTWNPTIPTATYEVLNTTLAGYYSKALDRIGSLYYTKEDFDNISPIYGSTYPDFQGGVGTTLEVGSTAGVKIETPTGIRTFARNIRDNVATSIASVEMGYYEKELLLRHQQDFFTGALNLAKKNDYSHFVVGSNHDQNLNRLFLEHLLQHRIEVYELARGYSQDGKTFEPGTGYVIPTSQPQYRLIHAIFEENTQFVDSIFMDITAWSTAHGYGIPFIRAKNKIEKGNLVSELPTLVGKVHGRSSNAYVFEYGDFLSPKAIYSLLEQGIVVKAAHKEFTGSYEGKQLRFYPGSIIIPVEYQTFSPDQLYTILSQTAQETGIDIYPLNSSLNVSGIDLGSNNIRALKKPEVATFTGAGINWTEVGEIWFLLGNRLNIPLTKIPVQSADRANLNRYTTIILADGTYQGFSETFINRLQQWVENGGTLITIKNASQWAIRNKLVNISLPETKKEDPLAGQRLDYISQREKLGSQRIGGALFNADLDISNPLAFGLRNRDIYAIKTGATVLPTPESPFATVLRLNAHPPISGYVSKENQENLRNAPLLIFDKKGAGTVILFGESPTFRGYWLSSSRLLVNSIFFGNTLTLGGRYRP